MEIHLSLVRRGQLYTTQRHLLLAQADFHALGSMDTRLGITEENPYHSVIS